MRLPREFRRGQRNLRRFLRAVSTALEGDWAGPTPFATYAAGRGLQEVDGFGSNPGNLRMLLHAPSLPPAAGAPLVVLLHGCGQAPATFIAEAGWRALAERLAIPLVLPAQRAKNNSGSCFNWFQPSDTRRGQGEVLSIRQMVGDAARRFGSDPARIFVAGLSAGGAMTTALLASYPDVFAAGASIAGLPVGCAAGLNEALACMAGGGPELTPAEWAARARAVGPGRVERWPRLSIWHGDYDRTVTRGNAEALVAQWTSLHGLAGTTPHRDGIRRCWGDPDHPDVEARLLHRLGHAFPIDPAQGGQAAQWAQNIGVAAAEEIARFWGLAPHLQAEPLRAVS